jgi:hypothetical protein
MTRTPGRAVVDRKQRRWTQHGFVHPSLKPNCADKMGTASKMKESGKVLFDGSYDPFVDGVVCFKGHVVASDVKVAFPGLDYRSGRRCWWYSTIVTKFEMLTFPEEATTLVWDCITNLIPTRLWHDSMVTPIQSLEIKVDDTSDRNVLKEKSGARL